MEDRNRRKSLTAAYKERPAVGGVLAIVCRETGKRALVSGADLKGQQNRFRFAVSTGSCVLPRLQRDWDRYGAQAFSMEVLETLERKPDEDEAAFRRELRALEDLWREKYREEELY